MILIDSNEALLLPPAFATRDDVVLVTGLELATGADMVLSVLNAPAHNESLQQLHIRYGEGIQVKRGGDLVSSVIDGRFYSQLCKMREHWETPWLVHVCVVQYGDNVALFDGSLHSYGSSMPFTYKGYTTAMMNWQRAGGCWVSVDPQYGLEQWVDDELWRMNHRGDVKLIRRRSQVELIPLSLQEETLTTFPGIGPQMAYDLWEGLSEYGAQQTLIQALAWLTDGTATQVKGVGKVTCRKAREHLGLEPYETLAITLRELREHGQDE